MEADIKLFINGIKDKTGINFSVYGADGNIFYGEDGSPLTVPTNIEGITSYEKAGYTLFPIKYKNKSFIGRVDGVTEVEKNYAYLIAELAENSYFKEFGLSRTDFCKAILLGEANFSQINRYMSKYSMKDMPHAMRAVRAILATRFRSTILRVRATPKPTCSTARSSPIDLKSLVWISLISAAPVLKLMQPIPTA